MPSYTGKTLRKAEQHLQLPFSLSLKKNDATLRCEQLVKVVPKRRAVLSGNWNNQEVLVKLFYRPFHILRHLHRETAGCLAIAKVGIPTPELLYAGRAKDSSIGILVFEHLHPISSLRDVWNALEDSKEKRRLFGQLLGIIANMHQAGLKQCDLHLDNFLLHNNTLYAIDGASVKQSRSSQPLSPEESLSNLGLLFAQLTKQDYAITETLFREYIEARGWDATKHLQEYLQNQVQQQQEWRFKKYFAKNLFRKTDLVICQRSFRHFMLCIKPYYSTEMANFLDSPEQLLDSPDSQLVNKEASSKEFRVQIANKEFVVHRYSRKGICNAALSCFKMSPAAYAWQKAHRDVALGHAATKPIALLENHFGSFSSVSFYISLKFPS